ncbi:DL-methionine transporter permease subunit [Chania multitudinisentens RB-25]|uniref:D-methionine transport system permease protein MetI n=1 Tax=Chania multitudinisentens RB-25 TaxID=1441930 RepID=W0L625_9GAMM|nr:methionine ABC transporter permease MetI [Chania multitudinisentens]AHG19181.1 DL-methionine transporter permease subunit [Chania multitudinisentens RB-25]
MSEAMIWLMARGIWETITMTFVSGFFGFVLGLPIGVSLYISRPGQSVIDNKNMFSKGALLQVNTRNKAYAFIFRLLFTNYRVTSTLVNIFRSIPFIILLVWMIPFTRMIVGTSIGLQAAIVPLTVGAAPFIARMVENALLEIPSGLIEAARAMGATPMQIIKKVLLPEALPGLVNAATITLITLVGYSAMGGAVGAGGLGQIGYQYGYIGYNATVMNTVLILLVVLVYLIQFCGDRIVKAVTHK